MANALVLKGGRVVDSTNIIHPIFDLKDGCITQFSLGTIKYSFIKHFLFRREDENTMYSGGGYFQESEFFRYQAKRISAETLQTSFKLRETDLITAKAGDMISCLKLRLIDPYTDFCKFDDFSWAHDPHVTILDVNFDLIIPPTATSVVSEMTLNINARGFYDAKILAWVNSTQPDKQERAFLVASIALKIHWINKDIFSLFTGSSTLSTYIGSQNLEWVTFPIFTNPTIQDLEDYYSSLCSFYNTAYTKQLYIQEANEEEKFYWLARFLSAQGMEVIPVYDKFKLLELITGRYVAEWNNNEALVLKIVESISHAQGNEFLDNLSNPHYFSMKQEKTMFETLFTAIDDDRLSNYTFGIFHSQNNRKKYILLLYKIWKSSKYNPKYADPSYTQPANTFGIYPESYYMELITDSGSSIQKTKYYDNVNSPAVLTYDSPNGSENNDYYMKSVGVDYILEDLKGKKLKIYRKETTTITTQSTRENNQFTNTFSTLFGTYDLYQPIALIGFKPDLSIVETFKDPETGINLNNPTPSIPVFLLYYMVDYSNLKKIDFGVMLVAEIALNATGVGALSDLRYLGYLSKARAVWTGSATASEVVLFWQAVTGVNGLVQFTAGNILAISNYVGNTTIDQDIKDFTEKVNVLLGILTLGSLLANPAMKRKLFSAAADVLAQERKLIMLGKVHGLDIDTMNAIRGLYDVDALIDLMQLKLNALPSYAGDTILTRFSTFTQDEKYDFFAFFYNMQEEAKWTKMNFQYTRIVNGVTETYTWVDVWKNEVQFLKSFRTFEFLESFYIIRNSLKLLEHVHEGHAGVSSGKPWITGAHNVDLLDNVRWRWLNESNVITDSKGYKHGKIERNMSDKGWSGGSPVSSWKDKPSPTTFWKKFSNDPVENLNHINEEMAYAFSNKKFIRFQYDYNGNIKSLIYHGFASDGKKIQIVIKHGTNEIITIYPTFP